MITIRNATETDIDSIMQIYDYAKTFMAKNGNPTQWTGGYPQRGLILDDIKNNIFYVGEENNKIVFCFTFIIGKEPTYEKITNGNWLNNNEYGTIHRIASNGKTKGVFKTCLEFCKTKINNIRIDTHENNKIMQHLIETNGFKKCGIVFMIDSTPRIAYQLV